MIPVNIFLCVSIFVPVVSSESVTAATKLGTVRGNRILSADGSSYVDTFLKIPFAKPPLGDLRFQKPQANGPWTGIRDGTKLGPQCVQQVTPADLPINEDCLYLNVYTPKTSAANQLLPVMVWIHGGGFYAGSANIYDGSQLASYGVVVVTINYRLGALGFLSTQDGASPGNYGLWDQIRALEWVRDSISAFNGNPNDVTIFGESAGSASVSLLVLTKAAKGLFHKAIMESGVSLNPWVVVYPHQSEEPLKQTRILAAKLGCNQTDTKALVACLRSKDAVSIVNVSAELRSTAPTGFRPVAESTFGQTGVLSAIPDVSWQNGEFSNVTTIRGFNKEEESRNADPENDGVTLTEFQNRLKTLISHAFTQPGLDQDKIYHLLLDAYVNQPNISSDPFKLRTAWINFETDYYFIATIILEERLINKHPVPPQYVYCFSFRSPNRLLSKWAGTPHADELRYVFGGPIANVTAQSFVKSWTEEDREISKHVMTLWTNFAKFGNPTSVPIGGVQWLPWTRDSENFLDINLPLKASVFSGLRKKQADLIIDLHKQQTDSQTGTIVG